MGRVVMPIDGMMMMICVCVPIKSKHLNKTDEDDIKLATIIASLHNLMHFPCTINSIGLSQPFMDSQNGPKDTRISLFVCVYQYVQNVSTKDGFDSNGFFSHMENALI